MNFLTRIELITSTLMSFYLISLLLFTYLVPSPTTIRSCLWPVAPTRIAKLPDLMKAQL